MNKFNDLFTGNPLRGSKTDFEQYDEIFKNSDINFNIKCIESVENCERDVAWTNSGKVGRTFGVVSCMVASK